MTNMPDMEEILRLQLARRRTRIPQRPNKAQRELMDRMKQRKLKPEDG
ncbi:hypothetical protein LCGC14_1849710 [marine sediment metagenome]|uniref:Uncharacterized protein n=1 Tax=marine sediment metagenome TaxID=412755 RepID=A0A0F9IQ99_9ZZZZ